MRPLERVRDRVPSPLEEFTALPVAKEYLPHRRLLEQPREWPLLVELHERPENPVLLLAMLPS